MTGLAALLDREVSTPAAPEVQLVDNCVKISLEDLVIDKQALSKVRKTAFLQCNWLMIAALLPNAMNTGK